MFDYENIVEYHHFLSKNDDGCQQAVAHYLHQISTQKILNAYIEVFTDEALNRAKLLDNKRKNGEKIGKLHGVVIAIKDVIAYKNHHLTASSKILENFISIYSATAIDRLLNEEAIIIGRLNCDEFAMGSTNENSVYGPVLNAEDHSRVSGGSSGGSAVAVQAGLCMAALGSDTGGSVRQPADFCGIVGLKPGYGTISRYGLIAYASSFDQIGILSNTIEDAALLLNVMKGPDEFDSTVNQKVVDTESILNTTEKYRFAYFEEALNHKSIDTEIAEAIQLFQNNLKHDGHQVNSIHFNLINFIVPTYYILTTAEASSNLSRYDGVRYGYRSTNADSLIEMYSKTRSEGFGKEVKRRIMLGTFVLSTGYYDAFYTKAQKVRTLLIKKVNEIFEENDFIIMPVSPNSAFKLNEKNKDPITMYLADIFTVFANLTGIPAISLPLFKHSNKMPFGIQVMSKKYNELELLNVAKQVLKYKTY